MRAVLALALVITLAAPALGDRAPEPPPPAKPASTTDFTPQVRAMFRVAACGSDDAIPAHFGAKPIERHCKEMQQLYGSYRRAWADQATKFIAAMRPGDLPKTVVYPFGGGDLTSALVVFPDATDITTISLEYAGDIGALDTIPKLKLAEDLSAIGGDVRRLYRSAHSTTKSLQAAAQSALPGTLMFALAGLAVHGMEPVALRYFDIQPDGTLRYLSGDELDGRAAALRAAETAAVKKAKRRSKHYWQEMHSAFGNVEIQFRPRGDARAPIRTYRHIVANLDDPHLTADGRVLVHLRGKGKVSVMTKAASFLLWYDEFSKIRGYLLEHMAWMISDASGIPPSHAEPAGFEQLTYGDFAGPYFIHDEKNVRAQFVKLWKKQPRRPLPFRFGYPDQDKQHHMLITRPKPATAPKP